MPQLYRQQILSLIYEGAIGQPKWTTSLCDPPGGDGGKACSKDSKTAFSSFKQGDFLYFIQHWFIYRPSESTVLEDAGIEPRTVATSALSSRRSNHLARSHPPWLVLMLMYGFY